jgi:hypothetical protein
MFFKKNNEFDLNIQTTSKYYSENISEFIKKTEYPSWMKSIPKFSAMEHFKMSVNSLVRTTSIRHCPAFIDIIKNSFSLYSPCDMTITATLDGGWRYYSVWPKFKATPHDLNIQMGPDNILSKNGIHMKFETPFIIKSNKRIHLYFIQPVYHNFHDFLILPGGMEINSKIGLQCNINTLLPFSNIKEDKIIKIKKGDLLCYLYYGPQYKLKDINVDFCSDSEEHFFPERLHEVSNFEKIVS